MDVLKARQKRLDHRRKLEILTREKRAEDNVTQIKSLEKEIADARPL